MQGGIVFSDDGLVRGTDIQGRELRAVQARQQLVMRAQKIALFADGWIIRVPHFSMLLVAS